MVGTKEGPATEGPAPSLPYDKSSQMSILCPSPESGTTLVVSVGSLTKVKRPLVITVPATGSRRRRFLPVITVLMLRLSRVLL